MEDLKEGYKKTEVGIIPEDWEEVRLGDITNFYMGKTPKRNSKEYWNNGVYKWVTIKDMCSKYITKTNEKISEKAFKEVFNGKITPKGTLLMSFKLTIGKVGILNIDAFHNEAIISIYPKKEVVRDFLYYSLNNLDYSKYIDSAVKGRILNKSKLQSIKILLPPLPEQKKIAQILSTWDNAIEKLEELINKKIEYKKGLMQKLLSGELRFPEFKEEWEEVRLGNIFNERNERNCEDLELLAVSLNSGVVKRNEIDIKDNSSSDKSKYKRVLPNDIVYNTMRMWQGASGVSKYNGIVSPAYTVIYLKEKNYDINFFGYLFKLPKIIFEFYRYSQGLTSDTWNLKYVNFSEIKVKIPTNPKEQKKIAELLSLQDKEIELLKKELNLLKEQKKGLMQNLLTGRIRVKV